MSGGDTVQMSFKLWCRVHQEEPGQWVAGCPRLDVYSQGVNREDAERSLKEAVELFIESCLERDTLDEVLRDCGFRITPPGVQIPEDVEQISVRQLEDDEEDELLGEQFPLEVTIPAYQAAFLMENSGKTLDAC